MEVRPDPLDHGRWWDATLNVVGGCEIVDPSCYFCYAPIYAAGIHAANEVELYEGTVEWRNGRWTWTGNLTVLADDHPTWGDPLRWRGVKKPLLGPGKPSLLWVNSMTDLFHPRRPPEAIHRILEAVSISPHIGLILAKRVEPLVAYFNQQPTWWRRKFWLGFSAGDQRNWDLRWEVMRPLAESGWLVFTSIQPMLELVVLPPDSLRLLRWVLCGGEQHPGHREAKLDWMWSLRDQCKGANPPLPFFVKQMTTGWLPPDLLFREFPKV